MSTQSVIASLSPPQPLSSDRASQWFAVTTVAKHEKAVAKQFQLRSIEHYLPLYRSLRHWKDRRVTLDLPLFSGYIVRRIGAHDQGAVQRVPGVLRRVRFNDALAPISNEEIERLQKVAELWNAEPYPYLTRGKRARACSGPMDGVEGKVL